MAGLAVQAAARDRGLPAQHADALSETVIDDRFGHGAEGHAFELDDDKAYEALVQQQGDALVPLFLVRTSGHLHVISDDAESLIPEAGEILIALAGSAEEGSGHNRRRATVATAS